jgi:hypothetical protein
VGIKLEGNELRKKLGIRKRKQMLRNKKVDLQGSAEGKKIQ